MNTRKDRGFTLVEIMVVVVILGMLATIVLPNVLGSQETAKRKTAITELAQIHKAAELYYIQNNRIPTLEDMITEDDKGNAFLPGYDTVPDDPWGNPYQIFPLDSSNKFTVWCNGPDGIEDTDDDLRSDKKQQ